MSVTVRLPRMLSDTANIPLTVEVDGDRVSGALQSLFDREPGLRNHIVDETGRIRPHVSVFVDGSQASMETELNEGSQVRILHAVSGG